MGACVNALAASSRDRDAGSRASLPRLLRRIVRRAGVMQVGMRVCVAALTASLRRRDGGVRVGVADSAASSRGRLAGLRVWVAALTASSRGRRAGVRVWVAALAALSRGWVRGRGKYAHRSPFQDDNQAPIPKV